MPTPTPLVATRSDSARLVSDLSDRLRRTTEEIAKWFAAHMPTAYFQDTDHETQLSHLQAIIAAKASGRPINFTLRSDDGLVWTSMRPNDHAGVLAEIVSELPHDKPLQAAKIHTADDGSLVLDTFVFGDAPRSNLADAAQAAAFERIAEYAEAEGIPFTRAELEDHVRRCSAEYALTVSPIRFCKHLELFRRVSGNDGSEVILETETDPQFCRIVVAVGNATTRRMIERIATRLAHARINIHRAYLDVVEDGDYGTVSLLGFVVQSAEGGAIDPGSSLWREVRRDLRRNKWVDHRALKLAYAHEELDQQQAELVTGLCDLSHQVLVKQNSYAFNMHRILAMAERNIGPALAIAQLLLDRFDPDGPLDDAAFAERSARIGKEIDNRVDLEDARIVLHKMLDAVHAVLRTNVHLDGRYSLAMRLDPAFLATPERPDLPYGVFFIHGRGYNGFHVRFRDIARGGLRVVRTRNEEQHALEAERLYDEAWNLAFAQQLKNKDIPEGGAKAAILADPYARLDRAVKGFVDGLLDLITPEERTKGRVIDRFGKPETLFLGPDENITPEFIEWIVKRASVRSYPLPTALMSSKPGAGINHKEYGVTSEGVNVFLDVALRALGHDPRRRPFTVKMTGGPDGDVGGNLIKILHRDYGNNARVVGIADGSGCGEDPDGLDLEELIRLVDRSAPIAEFDVAKLGPLGRISTLDEPEGVHLRNTLHFRIHADAFVPCGGRPAAIHEKNWREFLDEKGEPTSRLIVEGANLFLTAAARERLSEQGVMIMKDSSANKCGVITSSYEICSNMLLDEAEFLEIKGTFVEQVKTKLRELARREAELLVRVWRHHPHVALPTMSTRLSRVMIRTADAIEEAIDGLPDADRELMRSLVLEHLPEILLSRAGERVWTAIPRPYLKWMMAKSLAARIVYREGFEYLESMPMAAIASLAVRYLHQEHERRRLAEQVSAAGLADGERIATLLQEAGILSSIESA